MKSSISLFIMSVAICALPGCGKDSSKPKEAAKNIILVEKTPEDTSLNENKPAVTPTTGTPSTSASAGILGNWSRRENTIIDISFKLSFTKDVLTITVSCFDVLGKEDGPYSVSQSINTTETEVEFLTKPIPKGSESCKLNGFSGKMGYSVTGDVLRVTFPGGSTNFTRN